MAYIVSIFYSQFGLPMMPFLIKKEHDLTLQLIIRKLSSFA